MKKKIVIFLAGLLGAFGFIQEASAIPAFARQMGMACSACHFQHFPLLNSFGRSFKASGFTMIGSQAKLEGENLSTPSVLNVSALATAGYNNVSNQPPGTPSGSYMTPNGGGELSLFFGGRVSENVGFLSELAFPDNAPSSSAAKLLMLWDVGGARAGLSLVANNAPSYSLELLNTGANNAHRIMGEVGEVNASSGGKGNHVNVYSAAQYLGTDAGGHGASLVAAGAMGFVNIGKYNLNAVGGTSSQSNEMSTTYARGAFIFDLGGWDSAVGIQNFSGHVGSTSEDSKATIIDGQMQGEMGGMPVGLYASCGRAPSNDVVGNIYNSLVVGPGGTTKRSCNIGGELGVIPHKATVQLALRSGRDGGLDGENKDNAVMIGATYELAQNVELSLHHTANSGSAYEINSTNTTIPTGKSQTTLLVQALF